MKRVNAEYRKRRGNIDAMTTVSDEAKTSMKAERKGWYMGADRWVPFESYELSNLRADKRRLEQRARDIKATPADEQQAFGPVEIIADATAGHVLIHTPGKNQEATKVFRGRGWVWARSVSAWSRKLTRDAWTVATRDIGPALERV